MTAGVAGSESSLGSTTLQCFEDFTMRYHLLMQPVALCLALAWAASCFAAQLPPTAADEIDHLLSHLQSSGCQFNRNGDWHDAADAAEHLQKKLNYALDKGAITSAEDFIDQAATQSSMSGKAYQVRCAQAAPQPSGQWLREELERYRTRQK